MSGFPVAPPSLVPNATVAGKTAFYASAGDAVVKSLTTPGGITFPEGASNNLLHTVGDLLVYNGQPVGTGDFVNPTTWANFPAVANVDVASLNIINAATINSVPGGAIAVANPLGSFVIGSTGTVTTQTLAGNSILRLYDTGDVLLRSNAAQLTVQGQSVIVANSDATGALTIDQQSLAFLDANEIVLQVGNSQLQMLPNGDVTLSDQHQNNISMTAATFALSSPGGGQIQMLQTGNVSIVDNNDNQLLMSAAGASLSAGLGSSVSLGPGFIIQNTTGDNSIVSDNVGTLTVTGGAVIGQGIKLVNLTEINGLQYNPNPVMRTPFNLLVVPDTVGNAVVDHTLELTDQGTYFNVSCAGNTPTTYSVRFLIGTFPVGGTFYIKNTSATFPNMIDVIQPAGNIALGANPSLAPPGIVYYLPPPSTASVQLNSALCVVEWDGTDLIVN